MGKPTPDSIFKTVLSTEGLERFDLTEQISDSIRDPWIKVKDRLPELLQIPDAREGWKTSVDVLTIIKIWDDKDEFSYKINTLTIDPEGRYRWLQGDPEAWMPLPKYNFKST